jgi:hypothetical protein
MKRLALILSILWMAAILTPTAPLAASGRIAANHTRAVASCTHDCCVDGCSCCEGGTCTCTDASCKCCKDGKCDMKKCDKKCDNKCDKACGKASQEKK